MSHEFLDSPSEPDPWSRLRRIGKRALDEIRMATDAIDRYGRPPLGGLSASKQGYEAGVAKMKIEEINSNIVPGQLFTEQEIADAAKAVQAERLRRPPQVE